MLWSILAVASLAVLRGHGGEIPVDNLRDVNPRHFAKVLRELLKPALTPTWGKAYDRNWWFGTVPMRRKRELVGLHLGDLHLGDMPRKPAAIVVAGSLVVADEQRIDCDIWCFGSVTTGRDCRLRCMVAEESIHLGAGTVVQRWVDAGTVLRLGQSVNVVAVASAGVELVLEGMFEGGKVYAPTVRVTSGLDDCHFDRQTVLSIAARWRSLRASQQGGYPSGACQGQEQWTQPETICASGDYWIGPNSIVLHDIVGRGSVRIGADCVVAGDIHADHELRLGPGALIAGNAACAHLIMERGAIITGAAHVDGDAVLNDGAVVGLNEPSGGLAATGSVQLHGQVMVGSGIAASSIVSRTQADEGR